MNENIVETPEATTRPSTKEIVIALAKPVALVGFGVLCGLAIEKMKHRSTDTTEA